MLSPSSFADWINLSGAETARNIAEITILDYRVEIALEIYLEDVDAFERGGAPRNFALQVIADGVAIEPIVTMREPRTRIDRISPYAGMIDPQTRQRIPGPPEDDRVIYLKLEYPLAGQPGQLTLVPPLDQDGRAAVTIGFLAYHKAAPIIDFRYLSQAETVVLDWDDPWYTSFENPVLTRHHRWPLMSFLYVEPRQVRHEILMRVRDLMEWTDFGPSLQEIASVEDKDRLKNLAAEYLNNRNPLMIDGNLSERSSVRVEFLNISPTGLELIGETDSIDVSAAIMGVTQSYWIDGLPQTITVRWELFDDVIDVVPTLVSDPAGPFPSFIEKDYPLIEWQNFLKTYEEPSFLPIIVNDGRFLNLPLLSLVLFGLSIVSALWRRQQARPSKLSRLTVSAILAVIALATIRVGTVAIPNPLTVSLDETVVAKVVTGMLHNVNVAFLEKDPRSFDAALQGIVADSESDSVKAELMKAFAIPVAGGGVASVNGISDIQFSNISSLTDADGFRVLAGWTANATGQHWGHVDQRNIRFRALMDIGLIDDTWQLMGLTVVEAQTIN